MCSQTDFNCEFCQQLLVLPLLSPGRSFNAVMHTLVIYPTLRHELFTPVTAMVTACIEALLIGSVLLDVRKIACYVSDLL